MRAELKGSPDLLYALFCGQEQDGCLLQPFRPYIFSRGHACFPPKLARKIVFCVSIQCGQRFDAQGILQMLLDIVACGFDLTGHLERLYHMDPPGEILLHDLQQAYKLTA